MPENGGVFMVEAEESKVDRIDGSPIPDLQVSGESDEIPDLNRFSCEFCDRSWEKDFLRTAWPRRVLHIRLILVPAAVIFVLGTLVDVLVIGPNTGIVAMIVVIRFAVAAAFGALAVGVGSLDFRPGLLESLTVGAMALVSAVTCVIVWVIRGELMLHAMTAFVLIFIFYLVVPVRLISALLVCLTFSVGFVCATLAFLDLRPDEMIQVVLYLTLANVLGSLVCRERHAAQRREFFRARKQSQVAHKLRAEVRGREQAEQALAESEQRFRSLVELSPDAILVHRDGILLYINPLGERLLDVERSGEYLGRQVMDFVLPRYREVITQRLTSIQREGAALPTIEVEVRTPAGRVVACEVVSGRINYLGEVAVQSVIRDIAERKKLREELTRLATTDPLTGINNRRSFFDTYEREWSRARRLSRPLALLMFDVDHFKRVNDQHGHAVGDEVLRALVVPAGDLLRGEDTLARLGGEEFVVLLPGVEESGAEVVADRLRQSLSEVRVKAPEGTACCTVSVGVVQCRLVKESPDGALKRVDEALYAAKRGGRNRVVVG